MKLFLLFISLISSHLFADDMTLQQLYSSYDICIMRNFARQVFPKGDMFIDAKISYQKDIFHDHILKIKYTNRENKDDVLDIKIKLKNGLVKVNYNENEYYSTLAVPPVEIKKLDDDQVDISEIKVDESLFGQTEVNFKSKDGLYLKNAKGVIYSPNYFELYSCLDYKLLYMYTP